MAVQPPCATFFFLTEQFFSDKGPGDRKTLDEIRHALREDEDLMAAMKDSQEMKHYREEYYEAKEAESKAKVQRVSGKSMAQVASKTLDLLQAQVCALYRLRFYHTELRYISQCDYAFLTVGTNSFGVTTRGSFEKDTAKGFFGAGPADDFLREKFGISLAKLGECFDAYVCAKEACKWLSSQHRLHMFNIAV